MSAARNDLADRYLRLAVRLLPGGRRDWGRAMIAELPSIDGGAARWRFVLGCTAVALRQLAPPLGGWHPVSTVVAVAAVLAAEIAGAEMIGETVPLLVVLALLAWRAGRPGLFGPARPDRGTRIVRMGIYTIAGIGLVFDVLDHRGALLSPQEKAPYFLVLITFIVALFLSITADGATLGRTGLVAGAGAGVVAGVTAFLVLPFDRFGPPLAKGLPGHGGWLAVVIFAAPVVAAAVTRWRTGRTDQAVIAALCAGTVTAVVTAIVSLAGIVLFPGQIPDFVGPVMIPGTPLAERLAADATEAADPAAGLLAFSALLGAILWVVARFPLRRWNLLLLAPLSVAPIAFAASSDGFPGIRFIRVATWILILGPLAVTAVGRSRNSSSLDLTPVPD